MNSDVLFDIAADLSCALLGNKTTKATNVNIFASGKRIFYFLEPEI
jgi:hypothetical protein